MDAITKLGMFKGAVELAAGAGTGMVVGNLIKATTPWDLNKFQKVLVGFGAYAIGGALSDISAKYIGAQIDGYAAKFNALIHPPVDEPDIEAYEANDTEDEN